MPTGFWNMGRKNKGEVTMNTVKLLRDLTVGASYVYLRRRF